MTTKMKTVKIFKTTITHSYMMGGQGTGYSLHPHTSSMYYEGYDDGGKKYLVPSGYTIEPCKTGTLEFFDENDIACPLVIQDGLPAIVGNSDTITLQAQQH